MRATGQEVLRFGDYELTLARLALSKGGRPVKLRTQPLLLLALLAIRAGELVSHQDIHKALWNGRVVDFSRSVHVCIRQLRAALGDDAARPRYVQTVPRQGYRFVASVERKRSTGSMPIAAVLSSPRPLRGALVVAGAALTVIVTIVLAVVLRDESRGLSANDAPRDFYLRGKYLLDKGGLENTHKSVRYFLHGLADEAGYAPAHAALAEAYRVLGQRDDSRLHASEAVRLAPDSAEAHVQMAISLMHRDWDWAGARRHLDHALALDPDSAQAHSVAASRLALLGEFPAAFAEMEKALALDPVSTLLRADYGWLLYFAGDNDAAVARCREALDLDPRHVASLACLERAAEAGADPATATEAALRLMNLWGATDEDQAEIAALPVANAPRAYHEWRLRFFTTYPDQTVISPDDVADANAALGNYEAAIVQLERAAEARSPSLPFVLTDPLYAPLHADARFAALRARLSLPTNG